MKKKLRERKALAYLLVMLFCVYWLRIGAEAAPEAETVPCIPFTIQEDPLNSPLMQAADMAKVLYGTARYNSLEAQEAVCWVIINRTESGIYPNTIREVCEQTGQWMGYSTDNPVKAELFELARSVLEKAEGNGERPVSPEYLWFSWDPKSVTLRTSYEENNATMYRRFI